MSRSRLLEPSEQVEEEKSVWPWIVGIGAGVVLVVGVIFAVVAKPFHPSRPGLKGYGDPQRSVKQHLDYIKNDLREARASIGQADDERKQLLWHYDGKEG